MEAEARKRRFPIIGPQCGRRLAALTVAIGGTRVFEMGSGFGYSTLWFASAVGSSGLVVHTDFDAANSAQAKEYLSEARLAARCVFFTGDAISLLGKEKGRFDCILIDIEKRNYPEALALAVKKLNLGGLVFTHNALWGGRVAGRARDAATEGIRRYNKEAMSHPELISYLDPVDDGLAVSLKVGRAIRRRLPL